MGKLFLGLELLLDVRVLSLNAGPAEAIQLSLAGFALPMPDATVPFSKPTHSLLCSNKRANNKLG